VKASTRRVPGRPCRWTCVDAGAVADRRGARVRVTAALALTALAGVTATGISAQGSPLVVEARGGVSVPVGSFADGARPAEGTGPGASFGVDIGLAGGGRWTPYVGFSQHRFACEDAGCASDGRYVATGFRGGFRFVLLPESSVLPWLSLGAMTTHVETWDLGGAGAGVSDLGVGGELAVGVYIGGESSIALNPSARLAAANVDLPDGTLLRMRYLVADLAVVIAF